MDHDEYELFEYLPDRSLNWRGLVRGLHLAQARVWLLADGTDNECFAMDATGSQIVLARAPLASAKRILQIAYSNVLAMRAHLLRLEGYDVTSVSGNEAARFVLRAGLPYHLVVLGHAASEPIRLEMVRWLQAHYPNTRVVALNQCGHLIAGLRYNAPSEPAAAWLPMVSAAMALVAAGNIAT